VKHTCIIEQNIDFAETLQSPVDRIAAIVGDADVGPNEHPFSTASDDILNNLFPAFRIAAGNHHLCALLGETNGGRRTYP
jgi:hypothetical protein